MGKNAVGTFAHISLTTKAKLNLNCLTLNLPPTLRANTIIQLCTYYLGRYELDRQLLNPS